MRNKLYIYKRTVIQLERDKATLEQNLHESNASRDMYQNQCIYLENQNRQYAAVYQRNVDELRKEKNLLKAKTAHNSTLTTCNEQFRREITRLTEANEQANDDREKNEREITALKEEIQKSRIDVQEHADRVAKLKAELEKAEKAEKSHETVMQNFYFTGVVKDYWPKRGYGFIEYAADKKDIFVFYKDVRRDENDNRYLRWGQKVHFHVEMQDDGDFKAIDVH